MNNVGLSVRFIADAKMRPLFITELTVKTTNHAHFRDQQLKNYKNPFFVSNSTSLEFLTVFFDRHFDLTRQSQCIQLMKMNLCIKHSNAQNRLTCYHFWNVLSKSTQYSRADTQAERQITGNTNRRTDRQIIIQTFTY